MQETAERAKENASSAADTVKVRFTILVITLALSHTSLRGSDTSCTASELQLCQVNLAPGYRDVVH